MQSPIIHASPYDWGQQNVRKVMMQVQMATTPAILVHVYFYGIGILVQIAIGLAFALAAEAVMLKWRNKPLKPYLTDWSLVITVIGIAFCLPPTSPWWLIALASVFAIGIAKHLFGGLGYNVFNPAMAGYVFVLLSFPALVSQWTLPNYLVSTPLDAWQTIQLIFTGQLPTHLSFDALTGATPLEAARTGILNNQELSNIYADEIVFAGQSFAISQFWLSMTFLAGGLWLLYKGVIRWQMPVGFLLSLCLLAIAFHWYDAERYAGVSFHLFSGATLFAAFFIITDPVTGSTTPSGRLYFAMGIGALVYIIRTWGGYADAIAFAVLMMNMLVPWIDAMTIPRVYGYDVSKATGSNHERH